jgi:periplasmic divalent cation tolerance protein
LTFRAGKVKGEEAIPMTSDYIVVFVTCADESVARNLAAAVLEPRLAACVNILPGVRSLYRWNGEIQDDAEVMCIMKTRADRFEDLRRAIAEAHPYEVPEIIALPIAAGHKPYLDWIDDCVS